MKRASIGCTIVLAITVCLVGSSRREADGCFAVSPRGVSRWLRTPVEINTESALIIWDAENKTQHFIRKATFETTARNFGFLVPTPVTGLAARSIQKNYRMHTDASLSTWWRSNRISRIRHYG